MNAKHIKDSKERLFIMTQTHNLLYHATDTQSANMDAIRRKAERKRRIRVLPQEGQKNDNGYGLYEKEDKRRE